MPRYTLAAALSSVALAGAAAAAPLNPVTDGFPNLFDANMPGTGDVVTSILDGAVDYGLTPDVGIGVSAVGVAMLGRGGFGPGLKLRFRHFESERFRSTVTVYGGLGARWPRGSGYLGLTDNFAMAAGSRGTVKAHVMLFKGSELGTNLRDTAMFHDFRVAAVGGGYEHAFTRWFELEGFLFLPLYASYDDGFSYEASILRRGPAMVRLMADFRAGRRWLLSVGLAGWPLGDLSLALPVWPVLGAAWRF